MVDTTQAVYEILSRIADPEIPVLTILDLGIVRNVEVKDQEVIVTIWCPMRFEFYPLDHQVDFLFFWVFLVLFP
jgi:metal-sulfur cluster biosynthetic enzyme